MPSTPDWTDRACLLSHTHDGPVPIHSWKVRVVLSCGMAKKYMSGSSWRSLQVVEVVMDTVGVEWKQPIRFIGQGWSNNGVVHVFTVAHEGVLIEHGTAKTDSTKWILDYPHPSILTRDGGRSGSWFTLTTPFCVGISIPLKWSKVIESSCSLKVMKSPFIRLTNITPVNRLSLFVSRGNNKISALA